MYSGITRIGIIIKHQYRHFNFPLLFASFEAEMASRQTVDPQSAESSFHPTAGLHVQVLSHKGAA